MTTPAAGPELSSLATALEELTRRVVAIAEDCRGTKREDTAADLFAVEGLLDAARRRLQKVVAASP
jgi:hypothetical protein